MPGSGKDHPKMQKGEKIVIDDSLKLTRIEIAVMVTLALIIMGAIALAVI
jgi:hypothetical protein